MTSADSNCTRYMAGLGYVVYLVSTPSKGARHIRSKLVVVWYTSGELFTVVPYRLLCSLTSEPYKGTLGNTLVPFGRQYFGDNYRYQDDTTTPHCARLDLYFLFQGNVTKKEQPARSRDCNHIEHMWDGLGCAITCVDNPPRNLGELRQALGVARAVRFLVMGTIGKEERPQGQLWMEQYLISLKYWLI